MRKKNEQKIIIGIIILAVIGIFLVWNPPSINKENNKIINKEENLPYTNQTCEEIAPKNLTILFSYGGLGREMGPIKCVRHDKAEPGENIDLENLFTCDAISLKDGGIDEEGIVQRDYKINYAFEMDDRNCTYSYHAAGGDMKNCDIISLTCDWRYIN